MARFDGRRINIALFACLAFPLGVRANDKPAPENAAPHYRKAVQAMVPFNLLTPTEQGLFYPKPGTVPALGEAADELLQRHADCLKEARAGAHSAHCDWEHRFDETGPYTSLDDLQKSRQLANLLSLQVRVDLAGKKGEAAVEDFVTSLTVGRHVAADKVPIALLIGYACEGRTLTSAAVELPGQDPKTLRALAAQLDAVPAIPSVADSLRFEHTYMRKWWAKTLRQPTQKVLNDFGLVMAIGGNGDCVPRTVQAFPVREYLNTTGIGALVEVSQFLVLGSALLEAASDPAALEHALSEADALWDDAIRVNSLSLKEMEAALPAFREKVLAARPLVRFLGPECSTQIRIVELRVQTLQDMFRAGVAIAADGPDALKKFRDPFGDGPYGYREFKGGFELSSKFRYPNNPQARLTLLVGREQKE